MYTYTGKYIPNTWDDDIVLPIKKNGELELIMANRRNSPMYYYIFAGQIPIFETKDKNLAEKKYEEVYQALKNKKEHELLKQEIFIGSYW